MRIVCLSDTHCQQGFDVPDGDVLLHAGDFCSLGSEREVLTFVKWFARQPHRWKVVVAGNHDRFFETQPEIARTYLEPDVFYLQDSGCEIEGIRFWGAPWQPWFMDWAFNLPKKGAKLRERWNLIPMDTDVLITHCLPYGVLDSLRPRITAWGPAEEGSEPLGCEELAIRLASVKPRLHVFGHIHDGYGFLQMGGTTYVNASVCNEDYEAIHPVLVVDLEPNGSPKVIGTTTGERQRRRVARKPCAE